MKSRKELIREYKERRRPAGVFMVKNTANGKVLLGSSLNLEGPLNSHRFMLRNGKHENEVLHRGRCSASPLPVVQEICQALAPGAGPDLARGWIGPGQMASQDLISGGALPRGQALCDSTGWQAPSTRCDRQPASRGEHL